MRVNTEMQTKTFVRPAPPAVASRVRYRNICTGIVVLLWIYRIRFSSTAESTANALSSQKFYSTEVDLAPY